MNRRRFLGLLGGATIGAALSGCGSGFGAGQTGEQLASALPLPEPFRVPLPVPPVARPVGRRRHRATTTGSSSGSPTRRSCPALRTPILGYDGIVPRADRSSRSGPARPSSGTATSCRCRPWCTCTAATPRPTHDGYPIDLVLPAGGGRRLDHRSGTAMRRRTSSAGERDYALSVATSGRPRSGTTTTGWTSPARTVYRGLAGFHLVRDDEEDALPLPRGDRDLPLMICDRSFDADGVVPLPGARPDHAHDARRARPTTWTGVLGDVVLVNGAPWPVHEVDAARYRLRLLNASNARRFRLALDPPPPERRAVRADRHATAGCWPRRSTRTRIDARAGRALRRGRRLLGATRSAPR